ncbi:deoxyribonuclease IV [Lutispora thermophila]|uniref:Probable endonuclease 4 n=1 Tax=Lutispora thermophila DSM 19022 TaxID=1122184 RepID=A0A1M6ID54_9FIRM|nr:deoxyribonuclease IV [Lutispora thermophila]SHJ32399.1 Endonuclease IV [Lutispora thermophila DSM 19022]
MLNIGCHLSVSKGYAHMGNEALSIGASTFQFFTRNPRGGKARKLDEEDISDLQKMKEEYNFAPLIAHAPYTLNPASADPKVRNFAYMIIEEDLAILEYLPGTLYNFHPGSHVGQGVDKGIELIAEILNDLLKPQQKTKVLLETMAGKGSEIGGCFEELKAILDKVHLTEHIGVCLDTCHVYDGGYDIVENLEEVLEKFDDIIGLHRLYAIHINDSMNHMGSHKDRHARIGEGKIGIEAMERIINHSKLRDLPFILETPNDLSGYQKEIELLRSLYR